MMKNILPPNFRFAITRIFVLILMFFIFSNSFAQQQSTIQGFDDGEIAQRYVLWVQHEIEQGRMNEALAAIERASDFANVSSDISYLLGFARSQTGKSRLSVVQALDTAIETNRWVFYTQDQVLMLKAEQLIAMRRYTEALAVIGQIPENADLAMLRIIAFKGLAENDSAALARFRSLVLTAMDRYPRDPRPLKIFFEYARNRIPDPEFPQGDFDLLELALRRLPFLLDSDPELAWMAGQFMRNTEDARRIVSSYRAGGLSGIYARDFRPHPGSIPVALNLGIIDDSTAVEELFSGTRGINAPHPLDAMPPGIAANGEPRENPVLELAVINETYHLLRSEEGRQLFTQKLRTFTGTIYSDDDHDGYVNSRAFYRDGIIQEFAYDRNQENTFDFSVSFSPNELPEKAVIPVLGQDNPVFVYWERYPYVLQAELADEIFTFRPADFQYAPVNFTVLGGSRNLAGLAYPVAEYQNINLTKRTLVSFALSIRRPSIEFDDVIEEIFLERGIPQRAVETLGERQISITEFVMGLPVVQYLDFDFDGRMETIRRFRRPQAQEEFAVFMDSLDYRSLLASSESDWTGEGRFQTGEVYLQDGSVVYSYDIDGSGMLNYSETDTGRTP